MDRFCGGREHALARIPTNTVQEVNGLARYFPREESVNFFAVYLNERKVLVGVEFAILRDNFLRWQPDGKIVRKNGS